MRSKLFALWLLAFSFVPRLFAQTGISPPDAVLFNKAVVCIKEAEGWHGNHLPYVGYGHKILPHEKLTADMTEAQADSLLRADLRKLHKMCSRFGKDASWSQRWPIMSDITGWSGTGRYRKAR